MQEEATLRDVMSREFLGVTEGDTVSEVAELMIAEDRCSALVLRGDSPVGAVASTDILAAMKAGDEEMSVGEIMQSAPDPVAADEQLSTVLGELSAQGIELIPVTNPGQDVVGVITDSDALTAAASQISVSNATNADAPTANQTTGTQEMQQPSAQPEEQPMSNQGVCEACGTMTGELVEVDGQMLCPNCRTV